MDWEKFLTAYGPLAAMLWMLWKIHRDVVYKAIPDGFRRLENALTEMNAASDRRFAKQVKALASTRAEVRKGACRLPKAHQRKRRKKPRPRRQKKIRELKRG